MDKNTKTKIELFKKINDIVFATNYSSIDDLYPPHFIWHKTRIVDEIQKGLIFSQLRAGNYSMYVHFPFCRYKCAFCRQFSVAKVNKNYYRKYEDLLSRELELYAPYFCASKLAGIYLGGGTPTLFDFERILKKIYENFNLHSLFYLNIESTPDSLNRKKILALKKMGMTRLLIGVQSFDPKVLRAIGRPENQLRLFEKAYDDARQVGIPFINVELVCGLPQQSNQSFINDLNLLVNLNPDSIHVYPYWQTSLTALRKKYGPLPRSSELSIDKMYNNGCGILEESGYLYRGDDFVLDNDARNPSFIKKDNFRPYYGTLALGASSFSGLYLSDKVFFEGFNTLDLKRYARMINHKLLPIEKFYFLESEDDFLRMLLIKSYRYGYLSDKEHQNVSPIKKRGLSIREIYRLFKREFDFLKEAGKITIDDQFSRIIFNKKDNDRTIYSKIFYSPKVLKECKMFINSNPKFFTSKSAGKSNI